MTPAEAFDLALKAYYLAREQGPADETRVVACRDPYCAYWYACDVDQGPHDDTRAAACQHPHDAFFYALEIDLYLHPATLQAIPAIELTRLRERLEFD